MTLKRLNIKNIEWLISGILSVIVILIILGLIKDSSVLRHSFPCLANRY